MIRYPISPDELARRVDTVAPTWRERARSRTEAIASGATVGEFSPIWSEVKIVFAQLQHDKCCFCETKLEGAISEDVEHFRPKSAVASWQSRDPECAELPMGDASTVGYGRLAYHLGNYAVACKFCNSILKRNYFPIAGPRATDATSPEEAAAESAYLLYPVGDHGDNPEASVTFVGHIAAPVEGPGRVRGAVTIELLDLSRDFLLRARCRIIVAVYLLLDRGDSVAHFCSTSEPYTAAATRFAELYASDPVEATRRFQAALAYLREEIR